MVPYPGIQRWSGCQDRRLALKELDSQGQTQTTISDGREAAPPLEANSSREGVSSDSWHMGVRKLCQDPIPLASFQCWWDMCVSLDLG